jgi:hypothetical protein
MSNATHGGKGDRPRPVVDMKKFEENWDKIFGINSKLDEPKEVDDIQVRSNNERVKI